MYIWIWTIPYSSCFAIPLGPCSNAILWTLSALVDNSSILSTEAVSSNFSQHQATSSAVVSQPEASSGSTLAATYQAPIGYTPRGSGLEPNQLPERFKRKPIDDVEIEYILVTSFNIFCFRVWFCWIQDFFRFPSILPIFLEFHFAHTEDAIVRNAKCCHFLLHGDAIGRRMRPENAKWSVLSHGVQNRSKQWVQHSRSELASC